RLELGHAGSRGGRCGRGRGTGGGPWRRTRGRTGDTTGRGGDRVVLAVDVVIAAHVVLRLVRLAIIRGAAGRQLHLHLDGDVEELVGVLHVEDAGGVLDRAEALVGDLDRRVVVVPE